MSATPEVLSTPLRDLALLADGHGAALVSRHAAIEWLCLPRFDSGTSFAWLLDRAKGGGMALDGVVEAEDPLYLEDTLVHVATLRGESGAVRVVGFLALGAGRFEDVDDPAVRRSVLTLRGVMYEPTGALAAAPTTSLPEEIGGERNWDYRYSWVRDSTYCARTLADLGYEDEARRFERFVMRSA